MEKTGRNIFWCTFIMLVFPILDGIAAPMTAIQASGGSGKGNSLAMLSIGAVIMSANYISRKVRHHE